MKKAVLAGTLVLALGGASLAAAAELRLIDAIRDQNRKAVLALIAPDTSRLPVRTAVIRSSPRAR